MATMAEIEECGQRIGEEFHPDKVLLFGSYAYGTPTRDSDVDLLVITPFEGKSVQKSVEIRTRFRPPFPMDMLVRTPEKVKERIATGDSFMREIVSRGRVLYEAAHGLPVLQKV